jgi:hypothetical protein
VIFEYNHGLSNPPKMFGNRVDKDASSYPQQSATADLIDLTPDTEATLIDLSPVQDTTFPIDLSMGQGVNTCGERNSNPITQHNAEITTHQPYMQQQVQAQTELPVLIPDTMENTGLMDLLSLETSRDLNCQANTNKLINNTKEQTNHEKPSTNAITSHGTTGGPVSVSNSDTIDQPFLWDLSLSKLPP